MLELITILFAFGAAFLSAALTVIVVEGILERRSEDANIGGAKSSPEFASILLREESLSTISLWATLLEKVHLMQALQRRISEAQLSWTVGRFTALMLFNGTVAIVILANISWMPWVGIAVAGVIAALFPYFYVLHRRSRWMTQIEENFPDALDGIGRALRAGHPLASAFDAVAAEAPRPVAIQFRKVVDEWKLGLSWDHAMDNLVRRVPLVDVAVFAAAVKLHTRTGGRLTEVLSKLSETMREAVALRGEVRAIAAHGKLTGTVLTILPVAIAVVLFMVNPGYLRVLADHPMGKTIIGAAICALVAARLVINKMVDIRP